MVEIDAKMKPLRKSYPQFIFGYAHFHLQRSLLCQQLGVSTSYMRQYDSRLLARKYFRKIGNIPSELIALPVPRTSISTNIPAANFVADNLGHVPALLEEDEEVIGGFENQEATTALAGSFPSSASASSGSPGVTAANNGNINGSGSTKSLMARRAIHSLMEEDDEVEGEGDNLEVVPEGKGQLTGFSQRSAATASPSSNRWITPSDSLSS